MAERYATVHLFNGRPFGDKVVVPFSMFSLADGLYSFHLEDGSNSLLIREAEVRYIEMHDTKTSYDQLAHYVELQKKEIEILENMRRVADEKVAELTTALNNKRRPWWKF